VKKNLEII